MGSTSLTNNKKKKKSKATTLTIGNKDTAREPTRSSSQSNARNQADISFLKLTTPQLSCLILLSMTISQTLEFRQLAHSSLVWASTTNASNNSTSSTSSLLPSPDELLVWCVRNVTDSKDATSTATVGAACTLADQIWVQLKSTSSTVTTLLLGFVILCSGCWRNDGGLQQFRTLYSIFPLGATILLCQVSQYKSDLVWINDNKCWQMVMKTIVLLVLSASTEGFVLLGKSTVRNLLFQPFSVARVVFLVATGFTIWECYQLAQSGASEWIPPEMAAVRSNICNSTDSPTPIFFLLIMDKLTQLMVFYFGFICLQRDDGNTSAQRVSTLSFGNSVSFAASQRSLFARSLLRLVCGVLMFLVRTILTTMRSLLF